MVSSKERTILLSDNKKKESKPTPKQYLDLFYMTPAKIQAKDIADLIRDTRDITVELWSEMNVLELELSNRNTVDIEPLTADFKAASDQAFVKNHNIQTIFAINLAEEDLRTVKNLFEHIVRQFSGFLCTDSSDFQPVLVGSADIPSV